MPSGLRGCRSLSCVVCQPFAVLCGQNEATGTAHGSRGGRPTPRGVLEAETPGLDNRGSVSPGVPDGPQPGTGATQLGSRGKGLERHYARLNRHTGTLTESFDDHRDATDFRQPLRQPSGVARAASRLTEKRKVGGSTAAPDHQSSHNLWPCDQAKCLPPLDPLIVPRNRRCPLATVVGCPPGHAGCTTLDRRNGRYRQS